MSNKYQLKRTAVTGRTPNTTNAGNSSYIDAGELAINLPDGKLFSSNGSVMFEVGANLTNFHVTGNSNLSVVTAGNTSVEGTLTVTNNTYIWMFNPDGTLTTPGFDIPGTDGSNGQVLVTNGAGELVWANLTPSVITYIANTISLTNGAYISGNVESIQTYGDYGSGNYYNFTDGSGTGPAWILDVGFTDVVSFNRVDLNINYTQNSGHTIYVQLYNNVTSSWDSIGSYNGLAGYYQFALAVLDSTDYVSGGATSLRLYHNNAGNVSHETRVDYIALVYSLQGPQGPRGPTGNTGPTGANGAPGDVYAAANAYANAVAYSILEAANAYANAVAYTDSAITVKANTANPEFSGTVTITGNLNIVGTTTTVSTQTLNLADNMIYLNEAQSANVTNAVGNGSVVVYSAVQSFANGTQVRVTGIDPTGYNTGYTTIVAVNSTSFSVANTFTGSYVSGGTAQNKAAINPDLGIAGGYNDGSYHHAGIFRDATDGVWKVFDSYAPEPNGAYIDTANNTFRIADFQANGVFAANGDFTTIVKIGNTVVNAVINSTSITVGTVDITSSVLKINGSAGTNNYVVTSNGTAVNWSPIPGVPVYDSTNTLINTLYAVVATDINSLADVDTTTTAPANNNLLMWSNATSNWVPSSNISLESIGVNYTPATTTGAALTITAANTVGGTGYADFLKVTNSSNGATSASKSFRLNSTGGLEIINSAYSAGILTLTDGGDFSTSGTITPGAWTAGQVIKDTMLSNTDVTLVSTTIAATGSDVDFITYDYTPVSSSSYLIVHVHISKYVPAGTVDDS